MGKKRGFYTLKQQQAAISKSLLLEKSQQVSSTLSDGQTSELTAAAASIWGQSWGQGQPNHAPNSLFNNKSFLKLQFENHVKVAMSDVRHNARPIWSQEFEKPTTTKLKMACARRCAGKILCRIKI